jgi:enoyl-CoA hydratase
MEYKSLLLERDGGVLVLTLNRPERLNAISRDMLQEFRHALAEIEKDLSIKVLVLSGAGDRAFSVGADLSKGNLRWATRERHLDHKERVETFMTLWRFRIPVVTAIEGYALGWGFAIALVSDVTICSETALFGEPEVRHVATSPLLVLPWFAGNRKLAHYYIYTGDMFDAATAKDMGIVAQVVPAGGAKTSALRLARRMALVPALALEQTKDSLRFSYEAAGLGLGVHYGRLQGAFTLQATGDPDKDRLAIILENEGFKAFLEARDGPFNRAP